MDLNLKDKTVLITGGSKGLDRAIAHRFASEGCHLHLVARLSREYFRRMKARRSGVIVNLTGIGGDLLDPSYIAGGVGNAAMAAFTKSLGSNSHHVGVRVVGINPGPCATERFERLARAKAQERYGNPDRWHEALGTLPFGRPATPDEIAAAAVFLASPLSGYTTGAILTIDGGVTGGREIPR